MMNPATGKPFEGVDVDGNPVAGRILHGVYTRGIQTPTGYTIERYPQNGRRHGGYAIVSAQAVAEHLSGLELIASMESGSER